MEKEEAMMQLLQGKPVQHLRRLQQRESLCTQALAVQESDYPSSFPC